MVAHAWKYNDLANIKIYIDERIKVIYIEKGLYPYQRQGEGDVPIKEHRVIDLGELITEITVTDENMTETRNETISVKPTNLTIRINKDDLLINARETSEL